MKHQVSPPILAHDTSIIGTFQNHAFAEAAVKELADSSFDIEKISIIGRGFHSDEQIKGFYTTADRVKFWGGSGAFWGGLWGLFLGGMFLTVPVVGSVIIMGHLAIIAVSAIEGAILIGGLSALGAALYSIGVPKESVLRYEKLITADHFLLVVHGNESDIVRARGTLQNHQPIDLDVYHASDTVLLNT